MTLGCTICRAARVRSVSCTWHTVHARTALHGSIGGRTLPSAYAFVDGYSSSSLLFAPLNFLLLRYMGTVMIDAQRAHGVSLLHSVVRAHMSSMFSRDRMELKLRTPSEAEKEVVRQSFSWKGME